MKKISILIAFLCLILATGISQNSSDTAEFSVSVERECTTTMQDFTFSSNKVTDDQGYPIIGVGGIGYLTYIPNNIGEMSFVREDMSFYNYSLSSESRLNEVPTPNQSFGDRYLFNSTGYDAPNNFSRLRTSSDPVYRAPYWYDKSFDNWNESRPERIIKIQEFVASNNFPSGIYEAELETNYTCEFDPESSSKVTNVSTGNSINFSDLGDPSQSEISKYLEVDGINVTRLEKNDNDKDYARSEKFQKKYQSIFRIQLIEGNGSTPDSIANTDLPVTQELEVDADTISNLTNNASLDRTANKSENSSLDSDANETSSITKNGSLDTDSNNTEEANNIEGNNPRPGLTPEPEPEPEPEPVPEPEPTPLLSVNMRPLNTTYTTPRGQFKEVGMEVTNTGEETISNLELSPRFSEGMDWEAQSVNIGSLGVNETIEEDVFVQAGESVDPGIYQIPVFATNGSTDISNEYVNIEVTEEITRSELSITEAPQDIRFEVNSSYTVPVLLENAGNETLENVQIELQNAENCGDYTADQIESVAAGETASVSVDFQTSDALEECEATIVASSDSGSFAFSEMNVETVEEKGIVPQEFRVPIIASLWTLMLIIYTVVFKRYGLDSVTVKLPLIVLIAGEVFILVYLSATYYSILPPGLLPFSSA